MLKTPVRAVLVAASLSVVAALAAARSAPLQEPQRTEIVAADAAKASTPTLVRRAIIIGGQHHGWKPVADKPGVLTLTAASGQHQVSVDVLYDAHSFQVRYKDSVNMNEEKSDDKVTVHPKVNKWLSDLTDDIRAAAVDAVVKAN